MDAVLSELCQSGLHRCLLALRAPAIKAGWERLVAKRLINVGKCWSGIVSFCGALWSILSVLICCSIATIPNFFLLAILALTFYLAYLTRALLAECSSCAVRAAFTASVQYFWVLIWSLESSVKLISRRRRLTSSTSLGAKLDRYSIFRMISAVFLVCR